MSASQMEAQAPALVGGIPTPLPDIPICGVFMFLFACLAAAHMTVFQLNRKRGHWFLFNALIFGFGMSRIMATMFRLIWATKPTDTNIQLVAQIFSNAGILLIYVVNVIFSIRLLRSNHPHIGWHPTLRIGYKIFLYLVIPIIIMVIVVIVLMAKRPGDAYIRDVSQKITKFGLTYFTVIAATPLVLLPVAVFLHRTHPRDPFGTGHWPAQVATVAASTALACLEAGFRAGTTWEPARTRANAAWYDSKPAFYCFNFMIDVLIMLVLLVARIDRLLHVPNKCDAPGDYARKAAEADAAAAEAGKGSVAGSDVETAHGSVQEK